MTFLPFFVLCPFRLLGRGSSPDFCHEAMAEFVELLFLPLTTALETLKARDLPTVVFGFSCLTEGRAPSCPWLIKCAEGSHFYSFVSLVGFRGNTSVTLFLL